MRLPSFSKTGVGQVDEAGARHAASSSSNSRRVERRRPGTPPRAAGRWICRRPSRSASSTRAMACALRLGGGRGSAAPRTRAGAQKSQMPQASAGVARGRRSGAPGCSMRQSLPRRSGSSCSNCARLLLALREVGLAPVVAAAARRSRRNRPARRRGSTAFRAPCRTPRRPAAAGAAAPPWAAARRSSASKMRVQHGDVRVVALEEEVVRVAVGVGVHQDGAARARRRGRRGRSPGSRPPGCRAARCGSRCGRRACRCPCRRRWWPPSPRCGRSRNACLHPLAALGVQAGVVGGGGEVAPEHAAPGSRPACASACRRWPGGARRRAGVSCASAARSRGRSLHHLDGDVARGGSRG